MGVDNRQVPSDYGYNNLLKNQNKISWVIDEFYRASDSDIDLVSVEEFYKNAPDSIKPKNDDPHLLHVSIRYVGAGKHKHNSKLLV